MSTDFYARLEQRRGARPSAQTTAALARALRLTQDERDHLDMGLRRSMIYHPLVGSLTLDCQILTSQNVTERLVVFTASPGSDDADRLALLSVVGSQAFPGGGSLGMSRR
jgi:hypothetical protein